MGIRAQTCKRCFVPLVGTISLLIIECQRVILKQPQYLKLWSKNEVTSLKREIERS